MDIMHNGEDSIANQLWHVPMDEAKPVGASSEANLIYFFKHILLNTARNALEECTPDNILSHFALDLN